MPTKKLVLEKLRNTRRSRNVCVGKTAWIGDVHLLPRRWPQTIALTSVAVGVGSQGIGSWRAFHASRRSRIRRSRASLARLRSPSCWSRIACGSIRGQILAGCQKERTRRRQLTRQRKVHVAHLGSVLNSRALGPLHLLETSKVFLVQLLLRLLLPHKLGFFHFNQHRLIGLPEQKKKDKIMRRAFTFSSTFTSRR